MSARVLVILVALLIGCQSSQFVESELRLRNRRVQELERQIKRKDAQIASLQTVLDGRPQGNDCPPGMPQEAVEKTISTLGVSRINLGKGTGAKDVDRDRVDDGFQVVVSPIDLEGDVLKCPGAVQVELIEIANNGVKRPIGKWLVDDGTLRKTWKTGLFSQGYQITLPWQQPPASSKLRVVARLQTLDGRTFEAERDFEATINKNAAASLANLGGAFYNPVACPPDDRDVPAMADPTQDRNTPLFTPTISHSSAKRGATQLSAKKSQPTATGETDVPAEPDSSGKAALDLNRVNKEESEPSPKRTRSEDRPAVRLLPPIAIDEEVTQTSFQQAPPAPTPKTIPAPTTYSKDASLEEDLDRIERELATRKSKSASPQDQPESGKSLSPIIRVVNKQPPTPTASTATQRPAAADFAAEDRAKMEARYRPAMPSPATRGNVELTDNDPSPTTNQPTRRATADPKATSAKRSGSAGVIKTERPSFSHSVGSDIPVQPID